MSDFEASKFDSGFLQEIIQKTNSASSVLSESIHSVILVVNKISNQTQYENKNSLVEKLQTLGATNIYAAKTLSFVTAQIQVQHIPQLAQLNEVSKIGDGEKIFSLDSNFIQMSQSDNLDDKTEINWKLLDWIKNIGIDGSGTNIVVLDTGIAQDALVELPIDSVITRQATCVDSDINNPNGCIETSGNAVDDFANHESFGHGTRVASIIANQDISNRGIAYATDLINVKLTHDTELSFPDHGFYRITEYYHALDWIVSNISNEKPIILNASLFFDECESVTSTTSFITNEVVDNNVLFVTVTAQDSDISNIQSLKDPGCIQNVLTVGGLDDGNPHYRDGYASYPNARKGPALPSQSTPILKPEIIAPAVNIYALQDVILNSQQIRESIYNLGTGTSFGTILSF